MKLFKKKEDEWELPDANQILFQSSYYILKEIEGIKKNKELSAQFPNIQECEKIFKWLQKKMRKLSTLGSATMIELLAAFIINIQECLTKTINDLDIAEANLTNGPADLNGPTIKSDNGELLQDSSLGNVKVATDPNLNTEQRTLIPANNVTAIAYAKLLATFNDSDRKPVKWLNNNPLIMEFTSDGSIFMNGRLTYMLIEDSAFNYNIRNTNTKRNKIRVVTYMGLRDDNIVVLRNYIPGMSQDPNFFELIANGLDPNLEDIIGKGSEIENMEYAMRIRNFLGIKPKAHVKYAFKPKSVNGVTTWYGVKFKEDNFDTYKTYPEMKDYLPEIDNITKLDTE